MPDILGTRLKVGSLVPSTNSSVEPEFAAMGVTGVTHMAARIQVPNQEFKSDADAEAIVHATEPDLLPALGRLLACNPDRVIMAMAVPCFWNGIAGSNAMQSRLDAHTDVPVLLPPNAIAHALETLGIRRIGVVSPYMPLADRHVERWFEEAGFEASVRGLRAGFEDEVINITPQQLHSGFQSVNGPGVDGLVHVGTSIAMARLVEEFEKTFAKPVVSVNVACWWSTLRAAGIADKIDGYGRLFRDY